MNDRLTEIENEQQGGMVIVIMFASICIVVGIVIGAWLF